MQRRRMPQLGGRNSENKNDIEEEKKVIVIIVIVILVKNEMALKNNIFLQF